MKARRGLFITLVFLAIFVMAPNVWADVPSWFIEDMKNSEAILNPGTTTYCDENFKIENMGQESAHVQVILGNGSNYAFDMIEPGQTKSYSLKGGYEKAGGWKEADNVKIDEARIVNSTAGTSKLKVHCK
ncbi:hypothetical protein UR09_01450 [Candidatus Nitromaritima sp. SCGC AAA799-A02]|nr:hypothetical protein UR09_01450 [Candidatus Nitromaritima sp. SCGC AAA799-A02]